MKPKLAVLFDYGAATIAEVSVAAKPVCDLVLVIDPTMEFLAGLLPIMNAVGTVVEDTGSAEDVARRLKELGVAGIVTFTEHLMPRTAEVAALCGFTYHSEAVVEALRDKNLQRRQLAGAGVRTPRFAAVDRAADLDAALAAVGTPAVLKPRRGGGSRNTALITDDTRAGALAEEFFASGEEALVLEECLVGDPGVAGPDWGDYVSVESVTVDGQTRQIGVTGKLPLLEPFRESGHFFPAQIPTEIHTEVCRVTGEAISALGITTGISHTELKLTADGPVIIEVNGRLGGHINDLVRQSTGVQMVRLAIAVALGLDEAHLGEVRPAGIAFQFLFLPPVGAVELTDVSGATDLRGIDGVKRVEVVLAEGAKVSWEDGAASLVAIVYGRVPDQQALAETRDSVYAKFAPAYR